LKFNNIEDLLGLFKHKTKSPTLVKYLAWKTHAKEMESFLTLVSEKGKKLHLCTIDVEDFDIDVLEIDVQVEEKTISFIVFSEIKFKCGNEYTKVKYIFILDSDGAVKKGNIVNEYHQESEWFGNRDTKSKPFNLGYYKDVRTPR